MILRPINLYIAKNFLIRFLQITLGFSLLIFFINFIDSLEKVNAANGPLRMAIAMAFLQIPDFLNDISPSLILIAAIVSFSMLSSRSEISIIRMSGFSLWQVIYPIALTAFLIGIFWITILGPLGAIALNKFNNLEGKYVKHGMREVVAPITGIWIRQENPEKKDEELIIKAMAAYKENFEFIDVTLWFFDDNGMFYKKLDSPSMILRQGSWTIEKAILNEGNKILNKEVKNVEIATDLEPEFVMEKIVNNFQNVKLFSLFRLPSLIKDLRSSGFPSTKFMVHFHSLLAKPLLFAAMTLIACYFGLNHVRNNSNALMIFLGIVVGLTLYITSSIVNALGSSGVIPVFAATWMIAIICFAVGVLLIYRKEHF